LATTASTAQHQPTIGVFRIMAGDFPCLARARDLRIESGEGHRLEGVQAGHAPQLLAAALLHLFFFAMAGDSLAKEGMPHRHIDAHIARAVAAGTLWRAGGQRRENLTLWLGTLRLASDMVRLEIDDGLRLSRLWRDAGLAGVINEVVVRHRSRGRLMR